MGLRFLTALVSVAAVAVKRCLEKWPLLTASVAGVARSTQRPTSRLVGAVPGFDHDRQRSVPWLGPRHIAWITRDSLDIPYVHLAGVRADADG